ncbi:ion transporter [Marinilabilia salmonicolor]|uniref:ion transporter n=1 Tax=Marinilabilia salmonicolor TaxID=989 RepID=UPI00029B1477|nr:ion transporter [Marinilabilia salmonicolor]
MSLRNRLNIIVFYSNTKAGKTFDVVLLWAILLSVLTVLFESVPVMNIRFGGFLERVEWFFTSLFTLEYLLRIYISPKSKKYVFSFWGVIDFLAAIPSWLSVLFPAAQLLFVIRFLRFIRVFRVLKLARFTSEAKTLASSLKSSLYKITIFFTAILILVLFLGTLMYVIEGADEGFDSIPKSIYWAIITITTVGYGDLVPQTDLGKFIASFVMLIGYAIIAVPTGIVTAEISRQNNIRVRCNKCGRENLSDASYCSHCGEVLR